jgi:hypothetical protein
LVQSVDALIEFTHGGFREGSKQTLPAALLEGLLANGISLMAVNYRLSPEAPFPAHCPDFLRAIWFALSRAKEWNSTARVSEPGGPAAARAPLWLAFHDELADSKSADSFSHESTRLRNARNRLSQRASCCALRSDRRMALA